LFSLAERLTWCGGGGAPFNVEADTFQLVADCWETGAHAVVRGCAVLTLEFEFPLALANRKLNEHVKRFS
jgi:hypothetical protein